MKNNLVTNALVVGVAVLACLICSSAAARVLADTQTSRLVPAIYVLGDSTVDVGNANYLPNQDKMGYPFGIDLPSWFNGSARYSNGFNLADVVAQHVGFKMSPPPYLSLTGGTSQDLQKGLVGANYASPGSGILDTTGEHTLTMRDQVEYFAATKERMSQALDPNTLNDLLSQSLFLVNSGGNDFLKLLFMGPLNITEAPAYVANMTSTFISHIRALYNLGARRVGIMDVPALGCVPFVRTLTPLGECSGPVNIVVQSFNNLLRLAMRLQVGSMPGLTYSVGNTFNMLSDFILNPAQAGFVEVAYACCGEGSFNATVFCSANTSYCADRSKSIFWDSVHASQATCERGVPEIFYGSARYAEPINFGQLVQKTLPLAEE